MAEADLEWGRAHLWSPGIRPLIYPLPRDVFELHIFDIEQLMRIQTTHERFNLKPLEKD
jgi:hypothetical protein